ncbi:MAG TPA: hypothetical protein VK629_14830 [Steroidobacteraceae bacterium]|nr:hypothetical protein [Steroidobacteraceae bacterium]
MIHTSAAIPGWSASKQTHSDTASIAAPSARSAEWQAAYRLFQG